MSVDFSRFSLYKRRNGLYSILYYHHGRRRWKATNTTTSGGGGTVAVILHKSAGSSNSGFAYVDSFEFREALVRT
jgi:hypothetical protein